MDMYISLSLSITIVASLSHLSDRCAFSERDTT
jgi:hypothetical protein